jgi:hypothetical protein
LAVVGRDAELADAGVASLRFLDIETTGMGGAGAMAFLVGLGWIAGSEFVLRQYLARSPDEEGAVIAAVLTDADLSGDPVLVTFNGRRFDAPLLDERATMQRQRGGFASLRQVDLLYPSRTLYRGVLPDCRLGTVERRVLDVRRAADEVPGREVPGWYFRFMRSGDWRDVAPLMRHNAQDVVSLVGLTSCFVALALGRRAPQRDELLGLGKLLLAGGQARRAEALWAGAALQSAVVAQRYEAMRRLAVRFKARRRRDLACPLWRGLARRSAGDRPAALIELAMYYEHERRDWDRAEAVTVDALRLRGGAGWEAGVAHRLARIRSKRARWAAAG